MLFQLMPDGKSVGGKGVTDFIIDRIQTYYGYAIQNNKGNQDKVVKSIYRFSCYSACLSTKHGHCYNPKTLYIPFNF